MAEAANPTASGGITESGPSRSALVRSSAVVAVGTSLSRITGLLRVVALLYALGQTRLTDAFTIANTLPNLTYELLLGGILSATLVPVFTERTEDEDGGTSAVISVTAAALVVVTVIGVISAPWVINIFAGFISNPAPGEVEAYRQVGTTLLRFLMPQVLFYGLITVITALLHSRRSFAAPAYAPVFNNLVVSALLFALPSIVGHSMKGEGALFEAVGNSRVTLILGAGATVGVAAMALSLLPSLARQNIPIKLNLDWRHPAVISVLRLSGWTVGYVAANQAALYIVLGLATAQIGGDVTAYNVAFTFFQLPHGLFAVSIMTTFMPELTIAAQRQDAQAFRERFNLGLRLMALVILPASAGYTALAPQIVALLPLGDTSAATTAKVLAAFSVGLIGFSVYLYGLRAFYARKDTKRPFYLNLVENSLNVVLAIPLVAVAGVAGLAGAYSLAYLIGAGLTLWSLSRNVGGLHLSADVWPLFKMLLAAVVCGAAAWLSATVIGGSAVRQVMVAVPVGAAVYVFSLLMLGVEEVSSAREIVLGRFRSRRT